MGAKSAMAKAEITEAEKIEDVIHDDRRKTEEENTKERRTKSKVEERLPVWVKKSVLEYEKELKNLQIELLKLQNHVKDEGHKILMIFEGRDAAGKGGRLRGSLSTSILGVPVSWHSTSPLTSKKPNGIFSAMQSICPVPERLSCLTAAGTTVAALSRSWDFVPPKSIKIF